VSSGWVTTLARPTDLALLPGSLLIRLRFCGRANPPGVIAAANCTSFDMSISAFAVAGRRCKPHSCLDSASLMEACVVLQRNKPSILLRWVLEQLGRDHSRTHTKIIRLRPLEEVLRNGKHGLG
jgi:hypothetical protein